MASIETLRFVLLGDDRASSAFSRFARNVNDTTRAVDKNNLSLAESRAKLDLIGKRAEELGKMNPDIKIQIDDAAAKLKLAVLRADLRDTLNGPTAGGSSSMISRLLGTAGSGATGAGASGVLGITTTLPLIATVGVPALGALTVAAGAALVALTPVAAALVPITLGFGALAAVAMPEVSKVFTALTAKGTALKTALKNLSPAEKDLVQQAMPLKAQFKDLQKAVQPEIIKAFADVLKIIKDLMPALKPLIKAAGKALDDFLNHLVKWLDSPQGKSFINWLRTVGPKDIKNFGRVMWDIAKTVGQALNQIYRAGSWIDRFVTRWHEDWIIVKNVFRLIGDQIVIFALKTVQGILEPFTHIPFIGSQFKKARDAVHGELTRMVADAHSASNQIQDAWDSLHAKSIPLNFDLNLPAGVHISTHGPGGVKTGHAAGTPGAASGWAWVGEQGPELVKFKGGEIVLPSHISLATGRPAGYAAGTTYNIHDVFHPGVAAFDRRMESRATAAMAAIGRFVQNNFTIPGISAGFGGGGPGGPVEALMRVMAAARGWTGALWSALNAVEMREAGYNLTAQNPTSGAYGLAQFINGPAEYFQWGGSPFTAAGQITGMLNYVASRYGNPANAWAHELSAGWYGSGLRNGYFSRPTLIGVGERGPERVNVTPAGGDDLSRKLDITNGLLGELIDAVDAIAPATASGVSRAFGGASRAAMHGALYSAR